MLATAVTKRFADYQPAPSPCFCEERYRLLNEFLDAVHVWHLLQSSQIQAVIHGDYDFARFDLPIYEAQERKDSAKYAWIAHVETHHCEDESWL